MNLNTNLSFKLDPTALLQFLAARRILVTIVVVVGLLGYTGYQISQIIAVQPDQAYISQQQGKAKTADLKVSKPIIAQLQQLQSPPIPAAPATIGTQNPFSLGN
jgi:hypothetical protein